MAYSDNTSWLTRNNGQTITIDLRDKHLISARVKFRGIDGDIRLASTSQATVQRSGGTYNFSRSPGSAPAHTTVIGRRGSITYQNTSIAVATSELRIDGVQVFYGTTYPNTAPRTVGRNISGTSGSIDFYIWSDWGFEATYRASLRVRDRTLNPTLTSPHGTASYSGSLANGSESGWINLAGALKSYEQTTLTVNVSGSGTTGVFVEYEWIEKPVVSTDDPVSVGPDSATLKGNLISTGASETTRYFEYGKTTEYELGSINAGVGGVGSFTAELSGLDATETYYYRAYAVNAAGRTNGAQKSFTTIAIPPEVRTLIADDIEYTSARLNGEIVNLGGLPVDRWFEYSKNSDFSDSTSVLVASSAGLGLYNYTVTGLDFDTLYYYRAYGMNDAGRGNGTTRTLTTPYPYLYAPVIVSPDFGHQQLDDKPTFEFTLTENPVNPATLYHAQIRISQYVSINPTVQHLQSDGGNGTWQYYDGSAWQSFPAEGVPPETTVRVTLTTGLGVGPWYWDCASIEADGEGRTGLSSDYRVVRILLDIEDRLYILLTGVPPNEHDWDVYNALRVLETSNGQLGYITFEISNLPFDNNGTLTTANEIIDYGDRVLLAIKDWTGASEEFLGRVRQKEPHGDLLKVSAILADGILGERIIKTDYPDETTTITAYADNSTWLNITSIDDEGGKPKFTVTGHGMSDGDEVVIRNTGRYDRRWTVEDTTANTFVIDRDYDVEATLGECLPVDTAVLEVRSNLHGFSNGTRIIIKDSEHYDGVYTVSNVTVDTFEIGAVYEDDDAVGRCGALEDLGVTVKKIIDNYCQGIEAITDNVNLATGYIVPVSAEGKTAARVMEEIRRNYGLFYYVDKDAYLNLYKPEEIVSEPYPQMTIRRGDPSA